MMVHPFELIPPERRKTVFWGLFVFNLVVMVALNQVNALLQTEEAPAGIVSFELAGTPDAAGRMVDSWDKKVRLRAALGLGFDYLFMLTYSSTIGLACVWAGEALWKRKWPFAGWGKWLAWGLVMAAVLDAVENFALSKILLGAIKSPWPEISRWCATFKFGLIFLGLVYVFLALAASLIGKLAKEQ